MFKEIIATCLITFSCSSKSLYKDNKQNAYVGDSYCCSGAYCLKDEYDFNAVREYMIFWQLSTLDLQIQTTNRNDLTVFGGMYDDEMYTHDLETLKIHFTNSLSYIKCDILMDSSREEWSASLENVHGGETIDDWTEEGEFTYTAPNLVISFNIEWYLTGNDIEIFNSLFTKEGNRYVRAYNGYYHFNNGNWHNNNEYDFYYSYGAYFMFQSYIFNTLSYNSDMVQFVYLSKDNTVQSYVRPYDHGTYTDVGNVIVNGLLPQRVRQWMNSNGVFQYVQPDNDSTWYEMILATMDAPIYYLKQLLGFELFGMNLFIAFSSLLTLVIIIAIIKKVI